MIGSVIHQQYRILELLGEGGMGVVYKALDLELDRRVALKFLKAEFGENQVLINRFRDELRTLATFNHPNITTLYTSFTWQARPVMVMELVEGETLNRMISRRGPIPSDVSVATVKQALAGVGEAHRRSIVHRDLKPANLMLNLNNVVKVMDFGIAKIESSPGLTRTAAAMGTPFYMAPEQIDPERFGLERVDARVDIYAMGVTLYELLAGEVPFKGATEFAIHRAHLEQFPAPPTVHYPHIPAPLVDAVMRAMAKDPRNRFQSAEEFSEALGDGERHAVAVATEGEILPKARRETSPTLHARVQTSLSGNPTPQGFTHNPAAPPGVMADQIPRTEDTMPSGNLEVLLVRWFGYTGRPRLVGSAVAALALSLLTASGFGVYALVHPTQQVVQDETKTGPGVETEGDGAIAGLIKQQPHGSDGPNPSPPPSRLPDGTTETVQPQATVSAIAGRWSGSYNACNNGGSTEANLTLAEIAGQISGTVSLRTATGSDQSCWLQGVFLEGKSLQFNVISCSAGAAPNFLAPSHTSMLSLSDGQLSGVVDPQQPCVTASFRKM